MGEVSSPFSSLEYCMDNRLSEQEKNEIAKKVTENIFEEVERRVGRSVIKKMFYGLLAVLLFIGGGASLVSHIVGK